MNLVKNLFSHSACVNVRSLAPSSRAERPVPTEGLVSFPPVKVLVPYLMFTFRYDFTHGNSKIFLIVCLRDIIKEKKLSKIDENLGYVSDPSNLLSSPLLIRNMRCKQLSAEAHVLPVALNER